MGRKKRISRKFNKAIIAIMAIPFISVIMYANYIKYSDEILKLHITEGVGYYDIFSFWKMVAICAIAAIMIISVVINFNDYSLKKEKKLLKYYIPIIIYVILTIVSIIFSKFTEFALIGTYERYEGGLVVISYMIFVYYITQNIKDEIDIKYVIYSLVGASSIILFVAFLQGLSIDILVSKAFLNLIGLQGTNGVSTTFSKGWAYSTLYNPNYLGQYTVLLLPVFVGAFQYLKEKKEKIVVLVLIILTIMSLIFAKTSSAYLGIICSIAFFILLNIKFIWEKKVLKITFITVVTISVILIVSLFSGLFGQDIINTIDNKSGINSFEDGDIYIEDIIIEEHVATIITNEYIINMHIENAEKEDTFYLYYTDENENHLVTTMENYELTFDNDDYSNFSGKIYRDGFVDFSIKDQNSGIFNTVRFLYSFEDGILGIVGPDTTLIMDPMPNNMPKNLIGNEKMFSRRLYIWAVSVKNLKDNIFIGDGPDTFRAEFDHQDVIGKANMMHQTYVIVDKPHNIYLQIAQGSGVISLIVYLFIMLSYLVWSFKLYINVDYKDKLKTFGMLISVGVVAYLVSGMFIDSNVSVAPTFYFVFGLGLVVNFMIAKKLK